MTAWGVSRGVVERIRFRKFNIHFPFFSLVFIFTLSVLQIMGAKAAPAAQWRNSIGLWVGEPAGTRPWEAPKRRRGSFFFFNFILFCWSISTLYLGAPLQPSLDSVSKKLWVPLSLTSLEHVWVPASIVNKFSRAISNKCSHACYFPTFLI